MEIPAFNHVNKASALGIATGVFIAQVLAKTFMNMTMSEDDEPNSRYNTYANLPKSLQFAVKESLHQDTILMPAVYALLHNTKSTTYF